jgi:hypothetical protein
VNDESLVSIDRARDAGRRVASESSRAD